MFTSPRNTKNYCTINGPETNILALQLRMQTNTVDDCGLYTIAMLASLLLGQDPTTIVYNLKELHLHLTKVLEEKQISLFPAIKARKRATRIARIEECNIYCICRLPCSDGDDMVCCDNCNEWFHCTCLNIKMFLYLMISGTVMTAENIIFSFCLSWYLLTLAATIDFTL